MAHYHISGICWWQIVFVALICVIAVSALGRSITQVYNGGLSTLKEKMKLNENKIMKLYFSRGVSLSFIEKIIIEIYALLWIFLIHNSLGKYNLSVSIFPTHSRRLLITFEQKNQKQNSQISSW